MKIMLWKEIQMNNLRDIRDIAKIEPKFIAKLLNVTVHTYIAYEQEKMQMPPEVIKMIEIIYDIDKTALFDVDAYLHPNILKKLKELSMAENKYELMTFRLLGEIKNPNYHYISKVKNQIKESLKE